MEYRLKIVDKTVLIKAEFQLKYTENVKPFLLDNNSCDLTINVKTCDCLEQIIGENINSDAESNTLIYKKEGTFIKVLLNNTKIDSYSNIYFFNNYILVNVLKGYENHFDTVSKVLEKIGFENIVYYFDTYILHSSFIDYCSNGICFIGNSGEGKSTKANLWNMYTDAEIINGDRVLVKKVDDIWYGFGSPFAGSSRVYKDKKVKLFSIISLKKKRSEEISLHKLNGMDAFKSVFKNLTIPLWNEDYIQKTICMLQELIIDVPVYTFTCPPDERSVSVLKKELGLDICQKRD